jgi:tetratricopeptide (TPR) repeat protein
VQSPEDTKRGLIPWLRNRVTQSATRTAERIDSEPEVALESAQTTLSWSLRHRGPDSPLTVEAKREVAELLERTGRLDEALQLRSEIATSLSVQLGVDDPRTLIAEEFQGFILERLGRPAEALPHFEHVLSVRTDVLGRDDLATLLAMDRLGCVYRSLGNLEESRRLLQEAVDRFQSEGADETEECTKTMSHLATTLFQLEQVSESRDLRKHIFEVRNRLLGPDDPATLSSLQSLVDMLRWMGEDDATAIYQNLLDERVPSVGQGHTAASGSASEISVPSITRRVGQPKDELIDLLTGRPGWNLEASLTPGAPPLWGFRAGGKIEFSAATDGNSIRLYVRDTGAEIVFDHADELAAWLSANRPEALLEPTAVPTVRARLRKFGEWS